MHERITILGGGVSGIGAAILAKKKGFNVFLSDKKILSKDTKDLLLKNKATFFVSLLLLLTHTIFALLIYQLLKNLDGLILFANDYNQY